MPRQKLYQYEKTNALSIRMPASIREEIQKRAVENRRSLNQEIVWLILRALEILAQEQAAKGK
ncbi:MAG: Arc family DNA-binding protein [Chloroflexi bacterium]|nr:Arc family DNA-binding protein [Chloroflexota bacterium]